MNSLSSPSLIPLSPFSQAGSRSNPQSNPQSSAQTPAADASSNTRQEVGGLDEVELRELTELKARDREVRAHEAAHQATGGQHAGAMSLTYQRGPDGAQ
ncbi:MAG: putative metalloprotease CJM1_0395 family protein, partial [Marinobacter sp.]